MPWWVYSDPSQRQEPGHPNSGEIDSPGRPTGHEFIYGPFTKAQADAKLAKVRSPITPPAPIQGVLGGLGNINDFFRRLTEPSTYIRIGEVLGGALLGYIALKALTAPAGQNVAQQSVKQTGAKIKDASKKIIEVAAVAPK